MNNTSNSFYINDKQHAGQTDPGRIRKKNEDNWGAFPEQGLFFVADGIGGMPAGEIASMLIAEVLPELLRQRMSDIEMLSSTEVINKLKQAIIDLSNRILIESQNHLEYAGMGSTLVMLLMTKKNNYIAHLGDSRAYILKGDVLHQMTNDHTLVHHLLMTRMITQNEARHHPGRNQLVQYVGMKSSPKPDVICVPRLAGERLLLCSDGLYNMLSKQEINQFLRQNSSSESTCKALIKAANLAGGKDNITVLVVD